MSPRPRLVFAADDDPDDRVLATEAWERAGASHPLVFCHGGDELLENLERSWDTEEHPSLLILDLNMPGLDGRELLRKLRADPRFVALPTIVLTTSSSDEDIQLCYRLGANSYVVKPTEFEDLVGIFRALSSFWLEVAEVPPAGPADDP